jgi:phosphopantothenoylcysteine decarboxylase / phosphopantothenate---cysteine ligase
MTTGAELRGPGASAEPLAGRRIIVAVGGGIAAYKAAELVRLLIKAGAVVDVVMTGAARRFVGELTFQTLAGRPVLSDLFDLGQESEIGHIQVADRADLMIVAPATANLIARMAAGMADDAVTAVALATRAPLLVAPAMNVNMWSHPLTRHNVARLVEVVGATVVGPGEGFLACRWTGPGRLAEPADIVEAARLVLSPQDLAGKRVVIAAGPTFEPIDPVRFVGNRSSGKMGYALAVAARRRGASVTLIAGPVALADPLGVEVVPVDDARAMRAAVHAAAGQADVVVMTAAVADFRPASPAAGKIKRGARRELRLDLVANPDILAELGAARRGGRPLLVGFAAETEEPIPQARAKLDAKRCDLVVANDVTEPGAGFGVDTNHVWLVERDGATEAGPAGKDEIAVRILDRVVTLLGETPRPRPRSARPDAGKRGRRRGRRRGRLPSRSAINPRA